MKKQKKKKFWLRILLWIMIVLAVLLISLMIVLRWFFPDEQVRQVLEEHLAQSLGQPVAIQSVRLNPFGSIDFQGISIGRFDEVSQGDLAAQVGQISMWYDILPLLRKEIMISGIVIDQPKIVLAPPFQFLETHSIQKDTREFADSVKAVSPMPVSLNLNAIRLNDIECVFYPEDSLLSQQLHVTGINLQLSDLSLPKDFVIHPQHIQGLIQIETESSRIHFEHPDGDWSINPDLKMTISNDLNQGWEFISNIKIFPHFASKDYIKSALHLTGEGLGDSVDVHYVNVGINQSNFFQVNGSAVDLLNEPQFEFSLSSDPVLLNSVLDVMKLFVPESIFSQFPNMYINGEIESAKGYIHGSLKKANFEYSMQMNQVDWIYLEPEVQIKDFNFLFQSSGEILSQNNIAGSLKAECQTGSVSIEMSDTTDIQTEGFDFSLNAEIDTLYYPQQIQFSGGLQKLFNSTLSYEFTLNRINKPHNFPYDVSGRINVDSLSLAAMPFLSEGFDGSINLMTYLQSASTENVQFHLAAASDGLIYPFGVSQDTTPPLTFSSKFKLNASNDFQEWLLDSGTVQLNDLFKAQVTGSVIPSQFEWHVPYLQVNNHDAMLFIPTEIQNQLKDLDLRGAEYFTASGNGYFLEDSVILQYDTDLFFEKIGVVWPSMGLGIKELSGQISLSGDPLKMAGTSQIIVEDMYYASWRKTPLTNLTLKFNHLLEPLAEIRLSDGTIESDELGLKGNYQFRLSDLGEKPHMLGQVEMVIENKDSVEIMDQFYSTGRLKTILELSTVDQEEQQIQITGHVGFDHLNLMQPVVAFSDIHGLVPFYLNYNLIDQKLITDSKRTIYSWLEYELNRNFYKNRFPNLQTLRINNIETQGLQFKNLILDIDLSHGLVQIPFFNVLLFDGNLGGSFKLDYSSGHLDSMTYSVKAQAAQINSAAFGLANTKVTETSELNATMAFEGKGLDFSAGFNVNGYFYITKIGPRFASTLLQQMNPDGKDRSMTMTRRLLDTGWKPKRFSFDVRHSFVYSALSLSQPWFSPVKIPGELQYGRLPIQHFLQMQTH